MFGLRKDHRITLRICEAKTTLPNDMDCYCAIRVQNHNFGENLLNNSNSTSRQASLNATSTTATPNVAKPPNGMTRQSSTPVSLSASRNVRRNSFLSALSGPSVVDAAVFRTRTCWKGRQWFWDEEFDIELTEDFKCVTMEVWSKKLLKDSLLGTFTLNRNELIDQGHNNKQNESWYPLIPADTESSGDSNKIGTIRIRYLYVYESILPLPHYKSLLNLIMDPGMFLVTALDRATEDRDEISKLLVKIMIFTDHIEAYLRALCTIEIRNTSQSSVLFRGNSLASKSVDHFMKIGAGIYLRSTLQPIIRHILDQEKNCEIDKSRLEKSDSLENNLVALEGYIKMTVDRIFSSVEECPQSLRNVFAHLMISANGKWPGDNSKYTAVTGFFFLRLFNAAILGLFLTYTSRTFTLISKTIQQLANLIPFDGAKEPYMTPLNPFVLSYIPKMKKFLNTLTHNATTLSIMTLADLDVKKESKGLLKKLFRRTQSATEEKTGSKVNSEKSSTSRRSSSVEEIDIERQLAGLQRCLTRNIEKLQKTCTELEKPTIDQLALLLEDMAALRDRKSTGLQGSNSFIAGSNQQPVGNLLLDNSQRNNSEQRLAQIPLDPPTISLTISSNFTSILNLTTSIENSSPDVSIVKKEESILDPTTASETQPDTSVDKKEEQILNPATATVIGAIPPSSLVETNEEPKLTSTDAIETTQSKLADKGTEMAKNPEAITSLSSPATEAVEPDIAIEKTEVLKIQESSKNEVVCTTETTQSDIPVEKTQTLRDETGMHESTTTTKTTPLNVTGERAEDSMVADAQRSVLLSTPAISDQNSLYSATPKAISIESTISSDTTESDVIVSVDQIHNPKYRNYSNWSVFASTDTIRPRVSGRKSLDLGNLKASHGVLVTTSRPKLTGRRSIDSKISDAGYSTLLASTETVRPKILGKSSTDSSVPGVYRFASTIPIKTAQSDVLGEITGDASLPTDGKLGVIPVIVATEPNENSEDGHRNTAIDTRQPNIPVASPKDFKGLNPSDFSPKTTSETLSSGETVVLVGVNAIGNDDDRTKSQGQAQ
ncbi:hypothetical protein BKA69DRAFT_1147945 [Paraphysoderma sedebokerense]|nr:hypothetical protein BKA69DRAFT_1147945 [Paraphysoderma sedebokerense]